MRIQLIDNDKQSHISLLNEELKNANSLFICMAFLKESGLKLLIETFREIILRGANVQFVIGLDFYQTEPTALLQLHRICSGSKSAKLFLCSQSKETFHPKIYYWRKNGGGYGAIIGSANLTIGGLRDNFELSSHVHSTKASPFSSRVELYFKSIIKDPRINLASAVTIDQYKRQFDIYRKIKNQAEKEALSEISEINLFNVKKISTYLKEYKANKKQQDQWNARQKDYKIAKSILNKMAKHALSKSEFRIQYERLVGKEDQRGLWHSGGLYRKKNEVLKNFKKLQTLIMFIYSSKNKSDDFIIGNCLDQIQEIPGLGLNVPTEMLNTLLPCRFSVFNKNSTESLINIGCSSFGSRNKKHVSIEQYLNFNGIVAELASHLEFTSYSQVDHFLNFIYWEYVYPAKQH